MADDRLRQQRAEMLVAHADREDALLAGVLVRVAASVHHPGPAGLDPRHARGREGGGGGEALRVDGGGGDGGGVGLVDGYG